MFGTLLNFIFSGSASGVRPSVRTAEEVWEGEGFDLSDAGTRERMGLPPL